MKALTRSIAIMAMLALTLGSNAIYANGDISLVEKMGDMQKFLHKTGLSLRAKNDDLIHFYLHELEETIEELEGFGTYKEKPIGELFKKILVSSALQQ